MMSSANKYESSYGSFAGKTGMRMKYPINGGGRDSYIYNDNGGFCAMHGPRQ